MNKKIISQVKKFVKKEYQKPDSHYGYGPFPNHIVSMVNIAQKLADELEAARLLLDN